MNKRSSRLPFLLQKCKFLKVVLGDRPILVTANNKTVDSSAQTETGTGSKTPDLYFTYEKFTVFQPDKFIFSKIDESLSLGNSFNLKMRTDIPAAYFTTGQRVPEDIEIAYPRKFARRVFLDYNSNGSEKGESYEYE